MIPFTYSVNKGPSSSCHEQQSAPFDIIGRRCLLFISPGNLTLAAPSKTSRCSLRACKTYFLPNVLLEDFWSYCHYVLVSCQQIAKARDGNAVWKICFRVMPPNNGAVSQGRRHCIPRDLDSRGSTSSVWTLTKTGKKFLSCLVPRHCIIGWYGCTGNRRACSFRQRKDKVNHSFTSNMNKELTILYDIILIFPVEIN